MNTALYGSASASDQNTKMFEIKERKDGYEENLENGLREEARLVRQCFRGFAFSTLVFSAAVLGLVTKFQAGNPYVGLVSIPMIILLLSVTRIGLFKFFTHNRVLGYVLHLDRTRYCGNSTNGGWTENMRNIGWEEAVLAWRVVHATLYEGFYPKSKWYFLRRLYPQYRKKQLWFIPSYYVGEGSYYAGGYLSVILNVFHALTCISMVPICVACWTLYLKHGTLLNFEVVSFLLIATVVIPYILFRIVKDSIRLDSIEGGFLSIHSCAIAWKAVVVAHYRALAECYDEKKGVVYSEYLENLSKEAVSLERCKERIHAWVENPKMHSDKDSNAKNLKGCVNPID